MNHTFTRWKISAINILIHCDSDRHSIFIWNSSHTFFKWLTCSVLLKFWHYQSVYECTVVIFESSYVGCDLTIYFFGTSQWNSPYSSLTQVWKETHMSVLLPLHVLSITSRLPILNRLELLTKKVELLALSFYKKFQA